MTEGLGRSPRSRRKSAEDANDRFRRLAASDEGEGQGELGDTQPSQPLKVGKDARQGTQPSRAVKIGQTPPDEAPTTFPGAEDADWTPAPPPLGHTPVGARPTTDESGMPLPRRVAEVDPEATQVSGAAFSPTGRNRRRTPARGG